MENASKALIIAGAILLSILLISLGMMVFNQASSVVNSNSMDEFEILTFNSKFTSYEGTSVRGTNVNALISTIKTNNVTNQEDESKIVTINGAQDYSTVGTGYTFSVTTKTDDKTGLVYDVEIVRNQ